MQVRISDIPEVELRNNGITLHIADNSGKHIGKLRIGQATVEWCPGRTRIGNGKKISMDQFISTHLELL